MFRTFINASIAMTAAASFASFAEGQVSFRSVDFVLGKAPQGLVAADFNRDGFMDFAVATTVPPAIQFLFGDSRGGLVLDRWIPLDGFSIGKLAAADLNDDGFTDLLVGLPKNQQVLIFSNGGRGEFLRTDAFRTGAQPHGMAVADIDGNGLLDVVVANEDSDSVTIAYNRRNGFQSENLRVGVGPRHVALEDLYGDRAPELIVTNYGDRTVMIFDKRNGLFNMAQSLNVGKTYPDALLIRDLDKDGDLDISVAASGERGAMNSVWIWTNTRGGFDMPRSYESRTFSAVGLASADLNNDGFDDLVVSDRDGDSISIMFGKRDGSFKAEGRFDVGAGPDEVMALDVDGDNDIDLVTMNSEGDSITVLYNTTR